MAIDMEGLEEVYHYQMNWDQTKPQLVGGFTSGVEKRGPLKQFGFVLTVHGVTGSTTFTSKMYSSYDAGQKAMLAAVSHLYYTEPHVKLTTIEQINESYERQSATYQAQIQDSRENSPEGKANAALAASAGVMMEGYSSMKGISGETPLNSSKSVGNKALVSTSDAVVARGKSGTTFTERQITKLLAATEDDMVTLYRGTASSTKPGSSALFLTEDAEYVASYGKNIEQYQVSRSGFNRLKNEGLIETLNGVNSNPLPNTKAKGPELKIPYQAIKNEILKNKK